MSMSLLMLTKTPPAKGKGMNRSIQSTSPHIPLFQSRRDFLFKAGGGFGALALAYMLNRDGLLPAREADGGGDPDNPMLPRPGHHAARATSVIFLFMEGGPSHIDTFDPKPEVNRRHGQPLPSSIGPVLTPMGTGGNNLLGTRRKFRKFGQSGLEVS